MKRCAKPSRFPETTRSKLPQQKAAEEFLGLFLSALRSGEGISASIFNVKLSCFRAFTEIASIDLRLSVDFFIRLRWKDPRISFKDLRNGTSLNPLSDDEIMSLWTPRLGLTNGLSEFDSKVSEDSVSTFLANVRKRGKASKANIGDSSEISRYLGKWNDIIIEREYFHDFKCNFDMANYPFDVQKCFMNFTLRGTTDRQVILRKDSTRNISYLGEKRLVEYEIEEIFLEVEAKTESGFSSASVVVVFKRLRIYYYLNVFAQFILLMGVGFMSLIFPVTNFSDRVMTALTVMLVMTCNQQVVNVSQYIVEKNYYN